jgi:hypothetical protein
MVQPVGSDLHALAFMSGFTAVANGLRQIPNAVTRPDGFVPSWEYQAVSLRGLGAAAGAAMRFDFGDMAAGAIARSVGTSVAGALSTSAIAAGSGALLTAYVVYKGAGCY